MPWVRGYPDGVDMVAWVLGLIFGYKRLFVLFARFKIMVPSGEEFGLILFNIDNYQ